MLYTTALLQELIYFLQCCWKTIQPYRLGVLSVLAYALQGCYEMAVINTTVASTPTVGLFTGGSTRNPSAVQSSINRAASIEKMIADGAKKWNQPGDLAEFVPRAKELPKEELPKVKLLAHNAFARYTPIGSSQKYSIDKMRCDGIELDIYPSKEGRVVVSHGPPSFWGSSIRLAISVTWRLFLSSFLIF